jgi:hypothetical protein
MLAAVHASNLSVENSMTYKSLKMTRFNALNFRPTKLEANFRKRRVTEIHHEGSNDATQYAIPPTDARGSELL